MVESTILKIKYGSEFRRRLINHQNDVSYNDLVFKIQTLYKLDANSNIHLKYKDEDGDFISLYDDDDVALAIHEKNLLYIEVFVEQSERAESPLEAPVKTNVATIDPSRHEQVEPNGVVSHAQEVEQLNDPPKLENMSLNDQTLENVPIDDKPVDNGYYSQFDQVSQMKSEPQYQQPPQAQQQFQPQQAPPQQPPAPQPIYGGFAPPMPQQQQQYPPNSTPSLPPQQAPVSSAPYQGFAGYQPPSAPTPQPQQQASYNSMTPQPPTGVPQQHVPPQGFQPPPSAGGPPPSIPPPGAFPGGQAFNPFARGAPPQQQQAPPQQNNFNRPYGNY
ncbi:unnamed protein product [Bursaphelenchus okinawaensis]|uniref:PB1 domain-containing protein n=1 Tax=Bursaphelenchus okinawaensis TaxID=465554 RepID=A0A811JTI4_9BILA|nr:unnamed protein product [Bursaphelenchus okinawaensis]CAG9082294.1 unnamed protein product [Bursaphelenchus okinawaensis]